MLTIPMVMMLHTFENTMDSRLGSFGKTAGKLVPVDTSTRMQIPQKGSIFYVIRLIIKEVLRARQIQPSKSSYAESFN